MRKNMKQIMAVATLVLFVSSTFMGCGATSDGADMNYGNNKSEATMESGDILDYEGDVETTGGEAAESVEVAENRKIIEKVYLRAQTKEFDALMEKVDQEIKKVGGYIESSSVSGNSYEYDENRYAELTVRVPSGKSEEFTKFVSENSTITNKEITTEDVTLSYVDMQSRVSALETEKATLERLLAGATTMADVISVQERLTDVIYEIESYKSQLRTYDNLIDYTTITIRVNEVERVDIVEEQTVWEEIGTNLKRGFENVGNGFVRFFVFAVSSIPYLLVLAVYAAIVVAIVVICVKRSKKRKQIKKEKTEETE